MKKQGWSASAERYTARLLRLGLVGSVLPALSDASSDNPFAAASSLTLTPSLAAIEDSDSPGATTCGKAADAAAGAIRSVAAATESRPRRRTGSASARNPSA